MKLPKPDQRIVIPDYVMSIEKIEANLQHIDNLLSVTVDTTNLNSLGDHLADLQTWFPTSGNMVAAAEFYYQSVYELRYKEAWKQAKKQTDEPDKYFFAPSILKEYLKSRCADWIWLKYKTERQNRSLTHILSNLRTLISKEKEVFKQSSYSGQTH